MKTKNIPKITSIMQAIGDHEKALRRMEIAIEYHSERTGMVTLNYPIINETIQHDYFERHELLTILILRKIAITNKLDNLNKEFEKL